MLRNHAFRKRTVADVMSTPVVTVDEHDGIKDVAGILTRHGFNAVPVVNRLGRLVGIITEDDLVLKLDRSARDHTLFESAGHRVERHRARGLRAREVMSPKPVTILAEASPAEAAQLLHHRHLKSVPVVDDEGYVKGMITRRDLVRMLTRTDSAIAAEVEDNLRTQCVDLSMVRIGVEEGVVTFTGFVSSDSESRRLRQLAWRVEGVVGVRNWLVTDTLLGLP